MWREFSSRRISSINSSRWLKLIRAFDEIRRGEAVDQNFPFTGHSVSKKAGETVRRGETEKEGKRERERKRFWRFYNLSIRSSRLTGFMQFIAKRDTAELRSRFVISSFSSIDCELKIDGARSTTFLFSKGIGNIIIDVFLASMIKVKR